MKSGTHDSEQWPAWLIVVLACVALSAVLLFWRLATRFGPADDQDGPRQAQIAEGQPGPETAAPTALEVAPGAGTARVLWAYKAQEQFVASPCPAGDSLYVAGLGAFNTGVFRRLATEPDAPRRVLWSKVAPYIKRPTVSAPTAADGLVVFGDGMHQTDDALLYCVHASSGRPVWQLPLPGNLVHLEGSPAIHKGRVYIGGGEAGVLCVDLTRVVLDGRERDLPDVLDLIEKRWRELLAQYERDKQKDPDFAMPPSDDALPKPAPKRHWQAGQNKWHVDAPVAVAGDRVLAASARIHEDKVGRCCLVCLKAGDGSVVWETPLEINPWAGPVVAGDLVLVGCSSIRFDAKRIAEARGEVVAVELAGGRTRWRNEVPGGVLSRIAVAGDLAVFTATDGKVRACDVATGAERWVYDGPNPFFAGPALADGVVYAADLEAQLHAIRLADGKRLWTLDVPADPLVQTPGRVYATPAVHRGCVYVATCNLEGSTAGQPSAVVCISDRPAAARERPSLAVTIDEQRRAVIVPCRIAPRKLPTLKDIYPIEVIATRPAPEGLKAHETVVTCEVKPSDVHKALEQLGLTPGRPAKGQGAAASGPEVELLLELPGDDGQSRTVPIEQTLVDRRTGRPMPQLTWHFTGSARRKPDPNKDHEVFGADVTGTLVAIFPVTDETVLQSDLTLTEESLLKLETNKNLLPAEGTEARLIIQVKASEEPRDAGPGPERAFAPLAPFITAPRPAPSDTLLAVPDSFCLPPADLGGRPGLLPSERQYPIRQRPALGLPPIAPGSVISTPAAQPLRVGPLARSVAPRSSRLPAMGAGTRPGGNHPSLTADPTLAPSRRILLSALPDLRPRPAPFLRLRIPDPFESLAAVRLRRPPPDSDPPAFLPDLPAWPTLPVKP